MLNHVGVGMTPEQFVYWLQGFFELSKPENLTTEQVKEVKEHLDSVFKKFPRQDAPVQNPHYIPTVFPYPPPVVPLIQEPLVVGDGPSWDGFNLESPRVFFNETAVSC
jgi:hypothetical protein